MILLDDMRNGCRITYEAGFMPEDDADKFLRMLTRDTPFQRETFNGKPIDRATCAYGDIGVQYRCDVRFNFALVTLYPNGVASLGYHSDDEPDLVPGAPIASLSLGATRAFSVRRKGGSQTMFTVDLEHGSLLRMTGATQRHYQHCVPKRLRVTDPRINITFRCVR